MENHEQHMSPEEAKIVQLIGAQIEHKLDGLGEKAKKNANLLWIIIVAAFASGGWSAGLQFQSARNAARIEEVRVEAFARIEAVKTESALAAINYNNFKESVARDIATVKESQSNAEKTLGRILDILDRR